MSQNPTAENIIMYKVKYITGGENQRFEARKYASMAATLPHNKTLTSFGQFGPNQSRAEPCPRPKDTH